MTFPKRWTEPGTDSTELERELIEAGQRASLPRAQKQQIWAAIAHSTLPVAPPVQPPPEALAGATPAASVGAQLSAAKVVLGLVTLGALSSGAYWTFSHSPGTSGSSAARSLASTPPSNVAVPAPSSKPELDVQEPQAPATPPAADSSAVAASAAVSNPGSTPLRQTQLREESLAVLEIRRVLRAGDAALALRLLEQARVRFSHPMLGQEREALTIEALARSGAKDAAQRRAAAFLRAYPKSPYAADVRAFLAL
jgi:hypothetical protein